MRVCHVFQDEYPWDVRVEKISLTLAAAGHETVIVSRNRTGLPRWESLQPLLSIRRLPIGWTTFDRNLANFPAFFSPWWLHAIVSTVRRHNLDVILVRDLPLTAAALIAGRITGRPVIMDMAENYPAMLQATRDLVPPDLVDQIARNPNLLRRLERAVVPRVDGILVVSEASRQRVATLTAGRVPIWVVGNTPRLTAGASRVRSELAERMRNHHGLILLYVGLMDAKRGLDVLIRALPRIRDTQPDVLAVIVGKGPMLEPMRALVRELGLERHVWLPGWIDASEVPALVAAADIGIIPHFVNEHTNSTIPNKIYDYMAGELPVVVTHCQTLREIVEQYHCGRVCADRDPRALADAVLSLADPHVREQLGAAGRRAILETFNWDRDAEVLLTAMTAVAARSPRRL
jgi:glycosyltransferase involved in cell wall biosynthesis